MENKTMKTTEQINQIKTLKRLIADMVAAHKATKQEQGRSYVYLNERNSLFVAYTAYYMLRHGIEDVNAYIEEANNKLKEDKRNREYPFEFFGIELDNLSRWYRIGSLKDAVDYCIKCLDKFIAKEAENASTDGQQ